MKTKAKLSALNTEALRVPASGAAASSPAHWCEPQPDLGVAGSAKTWLLPWVLPQCPGRSL